MGGWWQRLDEREQRVLSIGGIFLIVLLFFVYLWQPLVGHTAAVYTHLKKEVNNLIWAEHAVRRMAFYESLGYQLQPRAVSKPSAIIQQALGLQHIRAYMTKMEEDREGEVSLHFSSVPFDRLANALEWLMQTHGIVTQTASIKRRSTNGLADVDLVLSWG